MPFLRQGVLLFQERKKEEPRLRQSLVLRRRGHDSEKDDQEVLTVGLCYSYHLGCYELSIHLVLCPAILWHDVYVLCTYVYSYLPLSALIENPPVMLIDEEKIISDEFNHGLSEEK